MPILRLSLVRRKFILVNGYTATITLCQQLWKISDSDIMASYPKVRINWRTREDGTCESGYQTEEQYKPVVNGLCEWLEKMKVKDPEPEITIAEGYKIYFNGNPVGTKLDFYQTSGSRAYFPKEFYSTFPVFYTKEECSVVLKKLVAYMLDQLKLKGHYSALREDVRDRLKELKFI